MATHGEQRGWHIERTEQRRPLVLPDGTELEVAGGHSQTVSWRYCAGCDLWVRVAGVLGAFAFQVEHLQPHRPQEGACHA